MSEALQTLRAAMAKADAQRPNLKIINTKPACFELLSAGLAIAGPEFAFVGKSDNMDGDGKFAPPGFRTRVLALVRPDGQKQDVNIVALSMDACWHVPSRTQFKAIVNSTDGEIEAGGKGLPARLDSYEIERQNYRWHNPIILQTDLFGAGDPALPKPPTPQAAFHFPSYAELGDDAFFARTIGEAAAEDWAANGESMNPGTAGWIARAVHGTIERFIKNGDNREAQAILKKVRNEWRAVMNNPNLPQL